MKGFEKIGVVGVDSGQLMVCDPCYLESQWDPNDNGVPDRIHVDEKTGKEYVFGRDFDHYQQELDLDGESKTWNEWLADGRLVTKKSPPSGMFSYGGCCAATLSDEGYGQLKYRMGHDGAGVAFSSGYGDGVYDVWARKNTEGRIVEVRIKMG